jgi:hypothetical protein
LLGFVLVLLLILIGFLLVHKISIKAIS